MIRMNNVEATMLAAIFNNFMTVSTNGNSTKVMGKTLEAFENFLTQVEIVEDEEKQEG